VYHVVRYDIGDKAMAMLILSYEMLATHAAAQLEERGF
jgi:hypothetical protein